MPQLTLTVEAIVGMSNNPVAAKLTRVTNSLGQNITSDFCQFCATVGIDLNSSSNIESAACQFVERFKDNSALLP